MNFFQTLLTDSWEFTHVNIAIRAGFTTNTNMRFSGERASHDLLQ